jgi:uncharacterized membrane protein SirB2
LAGKQIFSLGQADKSGILAAPFVIQPGPAGTVAMYLTVKTIHMTCALISFTGFLFRAYLMLIESKWLNHKAVLVLPHVIDTCFLVSGATMAFMVNFGFFTQLWLTTKVSLLMFYLLFVGIALNRGRTRQIRIASFFLAILTFVYIVGVAVYKTPLGWFAAF